MIFMPGWVIVVASIFSDCYLSLNFYGAFWNAEDFKHLCVKLSASYVLCFWCCEFAGAAMTKYCRPSGLSNTDLLPHSSGGGKSEITVLAGLAK